MADQNTVPGNGVVSNASRSGGDETEGLTSLSSVGSGHPRGVNEAGSPIPTGYEGQSNGVRMPGPMSSGFENGWAFNDDGDDTSGVRAYQGYIQGVQLPGGDGFEQGWSYGQDYTGLEQQQPIVTSNQNFGVLEGMNASFDGDDAISGRVIGTLGSNTSGVQTSDILSVFNAITSGGGQGASSPSGPVPGGDSMNGIVLGPGSGEI